MCERSCKLPSESVRDRSRGAAGAHNDGAPVRAMLMVHSVKGGNPCVTGAITDLEGVVPGFECDMVGNSRKGFFPDNIVRTTGVILSFQTTGSGSVFCNRTVPTVRTVRFRHESSRIQSRTTPVEYCQGCSWNDLQKFLIPHHTSTADQWPHEENRSILISVNPRSTPGA